MRPVPGWAHTDANYRLYQNAAPARARGLDTGMPGEMRHGLCSGLWHQHRGVVVELK